MIQPFGEPDSDVLARLEARVAALEAEVTRLRSESSLKTRFRPDTGLLLDAIAKATSGWQFTTSSLLQTAEMNNEEGDSALQELLRTHCSLNSGRLGQLLAKCEGTRLKRCRRSRNGNVWRIVQNCDG